MKAATTIFEKRIGNVLSFLITVSIFFCNNLIAQDDHSGHACKNEAVQTCENQVTDAFQNLQHDATFTAQFSTQYGIDWSQFLVLNDFQKTTINHFIQNEVCYKNRMLSEVGTIVLELTTKYPENFNWMDHHLVNNDTKTQFSRFETIFHNPAPQPKTLVCLNANFEMGDYTGWTTACGNVPGTTLGATNGENTGAPCAPQHAIMTGGNDFFTGSSRVFQGGVSARLGDMAGNAGVRNASYSRLRKTFLVDPSNPSITYSYMAVLEDPGNGHTNSQKPFFNAELFVNGIKDTCASYFSYFGDGQPGWVNNGGVSYRDWTSVFVPLENYIGQNVTLEVTVGDCSLGGHYAYAYVEVSCDNMEVTQFCEGSSTILSAPTQGIDAYLWSTGASTSSIAVTTPGIYTVKVWPLGSTCPAELTYTANIYPGATAAFTSDYTSICLDGSVSFTNQTTPDAGATIAGYSWIFGDGITTPMGLGALTGVPQTTGTFENPVHTFNTLGDHTVRMIVLTSDGCTDTTEMVINVILGPEATIAGNSTVCAGAASPVITFTGSLTPPPFTFSYTLNNGPVQTITTATTTATINPPTNVPGTYVYNLTSVSSSSSAMCEQDQSGTVTIIVNPVPTATIDQDATVCQDDPNPIVTFTGSGSSSEYIFSYTLNGGATQTLTTSGTSSSTISVPTTVAGSYIYSLIAVEDQATGCIFSGFGPADVATIVVNPRPTATFIGATTVCQNDAPPVLTFEGQNSTSNYAFVYNLNGGPNTTVSSAIGSNQVTITAPTNVAGTFTYTLTNVSDPVTGCNLDVAIPQVIIVNPLPAATIYGSTIVCQNDNNPVITFMGDYGTSDYTFTYSLNNGAPQTITTNGSPSITISVPTTTSTTYSYELISVLDVATGCSQSQGGIATVLVNPLPSATSSGTITVCKNSPTQEIVFTGTNSSDAYTFSYTFNNGPTQTITSAYGSSTATLYQSTAAEGTFVYTLLYVSDPATLCGQALNQTETIIVSPLPVAAISAPVEACIYDAILPVVEFTGSIGSAPFTFTYTVNGGAPQTATSTGSTYTFTSPTAVDGTTIYTITNIQEGSVLGCAQSQNISTQVTIHPLPIVVAGVDFSVCAGFPIVLTGSGAQTYDWSNNVVNGVSFIPTDTTTYSVVGTDINGCKNSDTLTVNVVPIPQMDFTGVNLYGCSPVVPTLTNHSTGNLTNCTWYLGNGDVIQGCDSITSTFDFPGCFDVTLVVSTPEGCTNSMSIEDYICVEANPIASFYMDPSELSTYDWITSMVNESTGGYQYDWNFGDGTPHSTEHSPSHAYPNDDAGIYTATLIVTSAAGCVDTAYQVVTVKDELLFYVPNTFTPDGDSYNEMFKPIFTTGFDPQGYTLYIFNRWGEMVFESHNTDVGWDGRYGIGSKLCQDDTYTWKIDVKKRRSSDVLQFTGHVNLIR